METSNSMRIAKNTGYLFLRTFLVLVVGLYTSRVVLKALGFEDFGIYNIVGSIVVFFSFFQSALTNATYRYIAYGIGSGDKESLSKTYSMAVNTHLLLAISLFIIIEIVGVWFLNHKVVIPSSRMTAANYAFQFSLITFCIGIIQTPFNSNIIAHEKMNFYAIVCIAEVFLKLSIAVLITLTSKDKLIFYTGLLTVVSLIIISCYIIFCTKNFEDTKYRRVWNPQMISEFAKYSGWSLLVNATDVTTVQCRSIFFNQFLGVISNAALGICNQVITHVCSFLNTFTQAFNPQIIKSYAARQYDYFLKLIYSTAKLSYILLFVISVPVVVNLEFILRLWLGEYPEHTASFIRIAIVFSLIDSMQQPLWQAVHATGHIKVHQIMMSSIKLLAIPGMYIVLKNGGSGEMAILVWVVLNVVCAIVRTIYMKFLISLSIRTYLSKVVFKALILTVSVLPIAIFVNTIYGQNWKGFVLSTIVTLLLTALVAYFICLNEEEKNLVKKLPVVRYLFKD